MSHRDNTIVISTSDQLLQAGTRRRFLQLMATERTTAAARRWYEVTRAPLAVLSALLVAGATLSLLGGLIWAGRWGYEQIQANPRYEVPFADIDCARGAET